MIKVLMKSYTLSTLNTLTIALVSSCLPLSALAQGGDKDTVQGYLVLITNFVGDTLLPFLFAIALLFFLVNIARYFIIGGSEAESQEKAKTLAIYGIGAFVFLISIWGIVNMFVSAFEIDDTEANCPDYLGDWCGSSGNYGNSGGGFQRFGNFSNEQYDPRLYQETSVEEFVEEDVINTDTQVGEQNIYRVSDEEISIPPEEDVVHEETNATPTEEESAPVNIGETTLPQGCIGRPGEMICDN